jgi:hypothetical protein
MGLIESVRRLFRSLNLVEIAAFPFGSSVLAGPTGKPRRLAEPCPTAPASTPAQAELRRSPEDQVELTWSRASLIFGDGTGFDFRV